MLARRKFSGSGFGISIRTVDDGERFYYDKEGIQTMAKEWETGIAPELLDRFAFYNYGHALEILRQAFPQEWREIQDCLRGLKTVSGRSRRLRPD